MKADYKNWVPDGMIYGFGAAAAGLAIAAGVVKTGLFPPFWVREPWDVVHGRHGVSMPMASFPMTESGNCPARSWKELRNISHCRMAEWVWMWAAAAVR